MGTVRYMSPEQVHGENVTHQTDIWALGVVLYEMITGQLPFKKENDHATIYAILNEEPEPLARLQPNAPVELTQVVNKAMAKNPAERYQRVDEMLSDLSSLQKARTSLTVKEPVTKANLPPSIAVLPFVNMCPDKENEYFSDGMTEEIINALTKIEGLRVASRTSVFAFKGKEENIRKIGDQLNVRLLLEGSVRKAGNRLRITAQLINVADGYHLWSETYDRNVQDVFAIQDEISRTIVRTLKIKLNSDPNTPLVKRHTDDLDAYQLYLKGRHYWSQRTKETLKKAVEHLARAIEKDPAYALAYSGLADCYNILGKYSYLPPKEAYPKAAAAAMKALAIDDTLAEAYASLGCVKSVYDWDWPNAKRAFQHAIELNPGYVTAHQWYAINYLTPLERMDEAIEEMLRARKLDPLSLIVNTTLGLVLYFAHQYDQAIEQYRKTLELDPNFGIAHFFLAWAYAEKARYEEAIAALQKAQSFTDDSTVLLAESGYVHAVSGNKNHKNQAMKIVGDLERINQKGTISPYAMYSIAATYASLGNRDRAFDWLHRAYKERSFRLIYLKVDPRLDNLRSDSRFAGLLKLVGLESR
jgi:TolB-like protein